MDSCTVFICEVVQYLRRFLLRAKPTASHSYVFLQVAENSCVAASMRTCGWTATSRSRSATPALGCAALERIDTMLGSMLPSWASTASTVQPTVSASLSIDSRLWTQSKLILHHEYYKQHVSVFSNDCNMSGSSQMCWFDELWIAVNCTCVAGGEKHEMQTWSHDEAPDLEHLRTPGLTIGRTCSQGFPVLLPRFFISFANPPMTHLAPAVSRIYRLVSWPKHGLSTVRFVGFEHLYSFM